MVHLTDPRRKRLLYLAQHRGTKEADIVIGGFAAANLAAMDEAALDQLEMLLQQPDRELYAWVTGSEEPPAEMNCAVLQALQAYDVPKSLGLK